MADEIGSKESRALEARLCRGSAVFETILVDVQRRAQRVGFELHSRDQLALFVRSVQGGIEMLAEAADPFDPCGQLETFGLIDRRRLRHGEGVSQE